MDLHVLLLISWLPVYIAMRPSVVSSRCRCINSTTNIRPRLIEKIEVTPPYTSCKNTEIIVTVQSERKCLKPDTKLGRIIMDCWARPANLKIVKRCVKNTWKNMQRKDKRKLRKKRKSKKKQ